MCTPDNDSCLVQREANVTYSDCVVGGPHTYTTVRGDTMDSIAVKLNLTSEALMSTAWAQGMGNGYSITENQSIKFPQCYPRRSLIQPSDFLYGTYKDLVKQLGTTPGQLLALPSTRPTTTQPPHRAQGPSSPSP